MPFLTWHKFLEILGTLRESGWNVQADGRILIYKNVRKRSGDPDDCRWFTPITAVTFVLTERYYLPEQEEEAVIRAGFIPTTRDEIISACATNNGTPERRQAILRALNL